MLLVYIVNFKLKKNVIETALFASTANHYVSSNKIVF